MDKLCLKGQAVTSSAAVTANVVDNSSVSGGMAVTHDSLVEVANHTFTNSNSRAKIPRNANFRESSVEIRSCYTLLTAD